MFAPENLKERIKRLSLGEPNEDIIKDKFVSPFILSLGFKENEFLRESRSKGERPDYSIQKNLSKKNAEFQVLFPAIIIEVKNNRIRLDSIREKDYISAHSQLEKYMLAGESIQFGILCNSNHLQLFRKYGKLILPITKIFDLRHDEFGDADRIARKIKKIIRSNANPLILSVYNNKGGVGKTTTVANLGFALARTGKKVLLVDLDPQQRDLTRFISASSAKEEEFVSVFHILLGKKKEKQPLYIRKKYKTNHGEIRLDLLPADEKFDDPNVIIQKKIPRTAKQFREFLLSSKTNYDYIIIDCPTNWSLFSKSGVFASDVVLIPVLPGSSASIHNAVQVIEKFIPEVQKERNDGGPLPLPIFFNAVENNNELAHAENELKRLIGDDKYLNTLLFPKMNNLETAEKHLPVIENLHFIPEAEFRQIANDSLNKLPFGASVKRVSDNYFKLIKNYFLEIK